MQATATVQPTKFLFCLHFCIYVYLLLLFSYVDHDYLIHIRYMHVCISEHMHNKLFT